MFPLSFAEYLDFSSIDVDRTMFYTEQSGKLSGALRSYMKTGGFPEVVLAESDLRRSELLRRGRKFCYYRGKGECDFITGGDESGREAIQVCWALDETNRQRELDSLLEAGPYAGASSCTIITADDRSTFDRYGRTVEIIPAWQWLLEP